MGRGDRVALLADRSAELVIAMLAVLQVGAAYVPLDTASPARRLAGIVAGVGATVVAATPARAGDARDLAARVVVVDRRTGPGPGKDATADGEAGHPLDAAYVMHTSGSTGQPKGIVVSHRAILRLVTGTDYLQLGPTDRVGHMSNVAFDAATFEIWGPLLNGGTVVGIDQRTATSPDLLASQLRELGVTTLFVTTALFNRIAADRPDALATLRCVLFGGEAVDVGSVRRVLAAGGPDRLLHVYGPTESTTFATWHEIVAVPEGARTIPIGRPLANTRAYVLDPAMRPVPVGAVGELHIGGDGLALGYSGQPATTAGAFRPDPFGPSPGGRLYRTGDLVRLVPDGFEFVGRRDHQVKLRGFRIELGEIEHTLRAHPEVRGECLVDHVLDGGGDGRLVAYVAAPPGVDHGRLRTELGRLLTDRLPRYMHPSPVLLLPELPLNANGKVDRAALRGLVAAFHPDGPGRVAPRTDTERRMAEIWTDVLAVPELGVHDDFFESGGHSLRATQLLSRIRVAFAVELGLREVFDAGTIEQLSTRVDELVAAGRDERAPVD